MRLPHFHFFWGDSPGRIGNIKLLPTRMSQLAGANKGMCCKTERNLRDQAPVVGVDGARFVANVLRLC